MARTGYVDVYDLKTLKLAESISLPLVKIEHSANDENRFYVIGDDIIYSIDTQFKVNTNQWFLNKNISVKQVYTFEHGIYVVSKHNESNALYLFDQQLRFNKSIAIPDLHFIQTSNYLDKSFWFHTPDGSYQYSLHHSTAQAPHYFFKGKSISGVIKDRQNNYWFTTIGSGLLLANNLDDKLVALNKYQANKLAFSGKNMLIGTQSGEILMEKQGTGSFSIIAENKARLKVNYLYSDSHLIMCASDKLNLINNKPVKIKDYELALKHVVRVDSSYYFVAVSGFGGLIKNPLKTYAKKSVWDHTFNKYINESDSSLSMAIKSVRAKSVAYDPSKNTLFCATNIGLYAIYPDTIREILINKKRAYASAIECHRENLYSLSSDGNLFLVRPDLSFELLNEKLRVPFNTIKWMKLKGENLYLINNEFILRYDLQTKLISRLNHLLNPAEVTDIESKNGKIYLATTYGITELSTSSFDTAPPPLFHLNYITVNDSRVSLKTLHSFDADKNNIAFNFSILDFGHYNKNTLYYKLNDGEWEKISGEVRTINFPSLSPGKYTVSFKLADKSLSENFAFMIAKPFWQQWWFYMLCTLPVYLISYLFYRRLLFVKTKKLQEQNEKIVLEQNLNKSILVSIRAQMNPHFFYNALNTIQAYIFINDKLKASSYLAKFSKLTRMILEMSDKEKVTLEEEIEALTLYLDLEKMRFKEELEYTFSFNNTGDTGRTLEIPSMIIQPFAENAIKHGLLHKEGIKKLNITFEADNSYLLVNIEDNGIGRKKAGEFAKVKAEKYKSFSTSANEKRIDLLNKGKYHKVTVTITDKTDASGHATGTKVTLKIPVKDV